MSRSHNNNRTSNSLVSSVQPPTLACHSFLLLLRGVRLHLPHFDPLNFFTSLLKTVQLASDRLRHPECVLWTFSFQLLFVAFSVCCQRVGVLWCAAHWQARVKQPALSAFCPTAIASFWELAKSRCCVLGSLPTPSRQPRQGIMRSS